MMLVEHNCHKNMMEWNSNSFPFAYFPRNTDEIEHHRTQGLWSVLCSHKWNYYLQGAEVIVCNDYKPLARILNGKNTNNKVNRWGLELATYNITFKWILEA